VFLVVVKPDESEMVELFLREAVIMKDFRHHNVLRIIGVTFDMDGSPMVVLPFMANGDLRQYILNPQLVCKTYNTD
jgi:serine/threonine protein kinase